ncbi:lipid-A-disaccharide synthase [Terriglobus aquaticus]|uniref:Lipid-A-disaccharide synthase n=1 Tax=Terriglobus aquaticus TaxID=940139 RepID=A0ABW9KIL0_9BACT|nr:lipid-A-disaccharide synthase [Terriglobus aquaticus]
MRPDPLIFVSAGEASGDHYGAELIGSLRGKLPQARFVGLGGAAMESAGQRRIVRAEDVAFMGITEIVRHIPRVLQSFRRLVAILRRERPDAAVLIDFPDVNFRLAKHCKRLGIPVIWFVSPQLWAWKRKRLRWVQERVSQMLTIFPFEEPFYRARGVKAVFVGHPLAEAPLPSITREEFAVQHHLDPAKPWIALLPGSRRSEVVANFPTLIKAANLLGDCYNFVVPVASGLDLAEVESTYLHSVKVPFSWTRDARSALFHSRAAAVASGTATVQAAVLGTPFVTVYRVSNLTFRTAKRLVAYPPEVIADLDEHGNLPVAMPNLIAGRRVTRELLQDQFTAENVVAALRPLLADGAEREEALAGLRTVRQRLLPAGEQTATERLRDAVLQALASAS